VVKLTVVIILSANPPLFLKSELFVQPNRPNIVLMHPQVDFSDKSGALGPVDESLD
jgi:hypothetical protein